MKMLIDREFVTLAKVDLVKRALKEFKDHFTESDLIQMHNEEFDCSCGGEVLKCTVTGFNSNNYNDDVSFAVSMILDGCMEFIKIGFYVDYNHETFSIAHDNDDILHTYEVYKMI